MTVTQVTCERGLIESTTLCQVLKDNGGCVRGKNRVSAGEAQSGFSR